MSVDIVTSAIKEPPPTIGPTEEIVLESLLTSALLASQRYQGTAPGVASAEDVLDAVTAYTLLKGA